MIIDASEFSSKDGSFVKQLTRILRLLSVSDFCSWKHVRHVPKDKGDSIPEEDVLCPAQEYGIPFYKNEPWATKFDVYPENKYRLETKDKCYFGKVGKYDFPKQKKDENSVEFNEVYLSGGLEAKVADDENQLFKLWSELQS